MIMNLTDSIDEMYDGHLVIEQDIMASISGIEPSCYHFRNPDSYEDLQNTQEMYLFMHGKH